MIEQLNAPLSKCHTQFCRNLWELVPPQNIIMCAITTDLSLIALIQSLNPRISVKVDKLKCNSIHTVWLHYNVDHCNGLRSLMWCKIWRKLSEHVNKGWHSCFWSRLDDRPGGNDYTEKTFAQGAIFIELYYAAVHYVQIIVGTFCRQSINFQPPINQTWLQCFPDLKLPPFCKKIWLYLHTFKIFPCLKIFHCLKHHVRNSC